MFGHADGHAPFAAGAPQAAFPGGFARGKRTEGGLGRLVYVQPVNGDSAAGSPVRDCPMHRCRHPLPKRPRVAVWAFGACHADAVLTVLTTAPHAVNADAARCIALDMPRHSCGGAEYMGKHIVHRQCTRYCRCGPAARSVKKKLPQKTAQRQELVLQDGGT